jgi:hypothetical protein
MAGRLSLVALGCTCASLVLFRIDASRALRVSAYDLPPDQARTVVFELFTPPTSSAAG